MKTLMMKNYSNYFMKFCIITIFLISWSWSYSQVRLGNQTYVGANTTLYIKGGALSFGTGTTKTKRTTPIGKIKTSSAVTFSLTGVSATQHIDGYLATSSSGTFTCPMGNGVKYAPFQFVNKSNTDLATLSFWTDDPSAEVGSTLAETLDAITDLEFWEVTTSGSGKVALTWDSSSDIATLTGNDLSKLVIAAYHMADNEWKHLPATPTGNVTSGSLVTEQNLDYSQFSHYTFAKAGICLPVMGHSGVTTTWNGTTWSHGTPTIYDMAVLNAPFSGSLACYSLAMNADLTLEAGDVLDLMTEATTASNAKVIMASSASVMQRDQSKPGPKIELTKTTAVVSATKYVYWGTPIVENFFSQISNATAQNQTNSNAFDFKFKYVSGTQLTTGGWQTLTATEQGKGFIARVAPQAPFDDLNFSEKVDMKFTGTAGNGLVDVPVAALSTHPTNARSHNLLANPYPSAIDGATFLRLNQTKVDGVIYVWNSTTGVSVNGEYSQDDYSAWTLAGDNTVAGFTPFNGIIPSGQGFKVRVIDYAVDAEVQFSNCMRVSSSGSNNNFYRMDGTLLENKSANANTFKVMMTSSTGVSTAFRVAFDANYTNNYDVMYDAYAFSNSPSLIYATLGVKNQRLAINALPEFNPSVVVPFGVRKNDNQKEKFTFKVIKPEGVFESGQNIYLYDSFADEYYDILNDEATLILSEITTNNRYQVRFEMPLSRLNNDNLNLSFKAWFEGDDLNLKSNAALKKLHVYDLMGRLIMEKDIPNEKSFITPFFHPQAAYLIKATTTSGVILTHKLINNPE